MQGYYTELIIMLHNQSIIYIYIYIYIERIIYS